MPVAFRAGSAVTTDVPTAVNTWVINAPSGLQDGDLILIFIGGSGNGSLGFNVSNEFRQLVFGWPGINDALTGVMWKFASGEGASWTFTNLFSATEAGVAAALAYTGVHTRNPFTGAVSYLNAASSTTPVCVATTPDVHNAMLISAFGADPNIAGYLGAAGAGWTERADVVDSTNSQGYMFVQDQLQTIAQAVAGTFTADIADLYGCIQFALRPAEAIDQRNRSWIF